MKESTREKIIDGARKVIWSSGINNVTVEEICNEANVSKMTFYRAYENKFDVVKEILDAGYKDLAENYEKIFNKEIPFNEKIMEIVYYNLKANEGISAELVRDIIQQDNPAIKDYMREKNEFYKSLVLKYVIMEQKKGNFREDVKLEFISFFIDHISELLLDERLTSIYESTDELSNQLLKMFYYGVMKRS
jgi:AcrR family transcriptional regulator